MVEGVARGRGITVLLAHPGTVLPVPLGPEEAARVLTQVLQVLMAGLPEGASIQISARSDREGVVTTFALDRPVAKEARRDQFLATGLGLWVARQILDRRGGRIDTPSSGEGSWRLVLPAA
jgi:signal transduction histidine kinase